MRSQDLSRATGTLTFSPAFRWLTATVFWGFVAALLGLQIWMLAQQPGESIQVRRAVVWQTTYYLIWIPLTIALWHVLATGLLDRATRWQTAGLHMAAIVGTLFLHSAVVVAVASLIEPSPGEAFGQMVIGQVRGRIYQHLVVYAGVVGSGYAFVMYGRWRAQADRAARLEGELAAATLSALRAQLHPHMLFNSLHAVASLVRESRNAEAVRLIADMSALLRRVLDSETAWHPLEDELSLAQTYLEIQRVRFESRLDVTVNVADELKSVMVPVLLLQPLVENALKHGFAGKAGTGHLTIEAARHEARLRVVVDDDGVGPSKTANTQGVGLSNLERRLATLYGADARFSAGAGSDGGFRVVIDLPLDRGPDLQARAGAPAGSES